MLTAEAFNALLKTLEEPPSHAIFILATTEAHKIPATVLSRCQRFDFIPLSILDMVGRLKKIAHAEGINYDEDGLKMIAAAASGGMRDAISILDQLSSSGKKINVNLVQETLGVVPERAILKLFEAIISKDLNAAFDVLAKISEKGYNLIHFRKTLLDFLRSVLVYKMSGEDFELKEKYSKEIYQKVINLSGEIEISSLIKIIKVIARDSLIEKDAIPSLGLEIALVELIDQEKPTSFVQAEEIGANKSRVKIIEKNFKDNWGQFLEEIKPHNHSLAAILRSARVIDAKEGRLAIEVDYDFHRKKIEDKTNIQAIEEALKKTFGKKTMFNCRVGKPQESGKSLKDIALEVFE